MQIKYPKENKVIRISNKRPKENTQNNELKNQIERMKYQIDELETSSNEIRINSNSSRIDEIENRITANNTAISGLSNRLSADEQSISNNSTAIGQTNNAVSQISSDLQSLSNNYTTTNNQVNVHTQQIANMIPQLNGAMYDIAMLSDQVDQNTEDIADLKANGTGGSGGSCDCAGHITSLDTRVSILESKINKILPDYIETIYKEIDNYERELDISAQNEVFTPTVLFSMNDYLSYVDNEGITVREYQKANLTINLSYKLNTADTTTFTVYNNSTVLRTINMTTEAQDVNKNLEVSIKAVASASIRNQNVYVVCTTSSENTTITLTSMNISINAPNVSILNKIQPFEVMYNYYTNKYYFSDCRTGYAKLAEIDANSFTSLDDLTWIATNIEAQNYKTYLVPETTMSSPNEAATIWKRYALIIHKNNTAEIINYDDSTKRYTYPLGTYKLEPYPTRNGYLMVNYICANKNTITAQYNIIQHTMIATTTTTFSNAENLANISATRNNLPYLSFSSTFVHLTVTENKGDCRLYMNRTFPCEPEILYQYVQDSKLYLINRISSSKTDYKLYSKRFNKFYCQDASFDISIVTLGNENYIGEYDDLFIGLNNNLFVVVNNTLQYVPNQNNLN